MKTLVLGLGNPILSDDGVGLIIARRLEGRIGAAKVVTSTLVGLGLLDEMVGYERLFLIDAVIVKGGRPGGLRKLKCGDGALHLFSSHGLDFWNMARLGKELGYQIPEDVSVFGVEIGDQTSFGNKLSPELSEKIASITETIVREICSESMAHITFF